MHFFAGIILWAISFWVVLYCCYIECRRARCEQCRKNWASEEEISGLVAEKLRGKGFVVKKTGDRECTISRRK